MGQRICLEDVVHETCILGEVRLTNLTEPIVPPSGHGI